MIKCIHQFSIILGGKRHLLNVTVMYDFRNTKMCTHGCALEWKKYTEKRILSAENSTLTEANILQTLATRTEAQE